NKMIGRWMAVSERARGSSLFLVAVGIGGVFTPPMIAWLMTEWGWRLSFVLCGAIGFGIAALWHFQSRDAPDEHPAVNTEELKLIAANRVTVCSATRFPWHRIVAGTNIPSLLIANFMLGYVTY